MGEEAVIGERRAGGGVAEKGREQRPLYVVGAPVGKRVDLSSTRRLGRTAPGT
jgi:hypothetical protein